MMTDNFMKDYGRSVFIFSTKVTKYFPPQVIALE